MHFYNILLCARDVTEKKSVVSKKEVYLTHVLVWKTGRSPNESQV